MDAISHALLGAAVAGISGHPASITDPIYAASIIGSQAPDFDIVAIIRGNFTFLKQHRAFSHSLPGVTLWASLITAGFSLLIPGSDYIQIFIWSFLGGLSHIILDYFNAHGAAVLWPINRKRQSFSLLNVFDPLLLTIMLTIFLQRLPARETSLLFFVSIILYIMIRYFLKKQATLWLYQYFTDNVPARLLVMPSLKSIRNWDFVVETAEHYYVGQISAFRQSIKIHTRLAKQTSSPAMLAAHDTLIGRFFSSFTPFSYVTECHSNEQPGKSVTIYDLRYFLNHDFLHSATILFNNDEHPCASYIKTSGRIIKIPC
jgi:inner membrane protein